MRIKVEVGKSGTGRGLGRARVVIIELLPAITFRYVDWELGRELNIYLSWLAWQFTVTMTSNKHK